MLPRFSEWPECDDEECESEFPDAEPLANPLADASPFALADTLTVTFVVPFVVVTVKLVLTFDETWTYALVLTLTFVSLCFACAGIVASRTMVAHATRTPPAM
jgi:hypothetical protein